ncbi:MAG: sulfatase-like hydrolase/transferase, partial [Chthoniobacteraceae bacterium]
MVGITAWQQQIPLPAVYFASSTNNENNAGSLGFGQPNYWRLPLVPAVAGAPTLIFTPGSTTNNFQRGAIALASNGIAIFNPANNRGEVSYEIGELDYYGGHCGLADDYHYHIIPMHLSSRFGGPLGDDKPIAWALDGYPIYGYFEPDGAARQALDSNGGHNIGNGGGYHYHAIGNANVDAAHPYGTPQTPYTMTSFRGTVVNFGGQVDGQPEVGSLRADGQFGYNAKAIPGAYIVAMINPAALTTDGSGNYIENTAPNAPTSPDAYIMRVNMGGTNYDECWTIDRTVNPRTLTVTWRAQALISGQLSGPVVTTTHTYTPTAGTASGNRLTAYPMGAWSEAKLPDTSQVVNTTATFGEDADYPGNVQSFTDNGNGTITDNVTGLMWQKVDNGESTWETAVNNAPSVNTGGYTDWRLPNPQELFSIFNHENNNPALNTTYFPNHPAGAAEYWWSRDVFGTSTTNVWCVNAGGGAGGKPKAETLSAGGSFRYHARYVRGAQNNLGHNYVNNLDGTITDTDTGLMWTQVPAPATGWDAALTYAENLTLAGYSDWRLPDIKELQTLTDYSLATASGSGTSAAGTRPSINRTTFAKTLTNCATAAASPTVTCADTTGLQVGMPLVDPFSIANTYINNTTAPSITGITNSTTFTISTAATAAGTGLTFRALPVPTAYWSSTSLKGDTSKAWLLELGYNSTVSAANGPPRGSQGIISYEAKTSTYPIFAVRSAPVTTQIAVEQPAGTGLTDGVSVVGFGNVIVGGTLSKTFTIRNNGSTSLSITGTSIDGTNAALFSVTTAPASTIAAGGSTTMVVQFNASTVGSKIAALHIASSDTSVGTSFDITLSGTGYVPPPTITNITTNPVSPTNADPVYVTAQVNAASGATISGVQLTYDTGAQVTANIFKEVFGTAAANPWATGTGAINSWTTAGGGNTREAVQASNRTPITTLTGCATTSGLSTVTCANTAALWPGLVITGTNIPTASKVSSVTDATHFVLTTNATAAGTGLTLYANGMTVTNAITTTGSTTVTCDNAVGLLAGMGLSGTGLANNATVSSVTDATHFVMNANPTTPISNFTISATGSAVEFQAGTANATDSMFTTTNAINATGSAGYIEFYMQTRDVAATNNGGWIFQVSPDGGATWNTRLSEDWNSNTVSLANCVLNTAGSGTGSTTVTCTSTAGLTTGRAVAGPNIYVTGNTTNTSAVVTNTDTTNLKVGMFVSAAAGLGNNVRILTIDSATQFTMTANATANGTAVAFAATYFAANATVSSITNGTTFVLSTAAYVNTTASPIPATATTMNHGYATKVDGTAQPYHYDLQSTERNASMKMRWQYVGYSATSPTRQPRINVDDIVVNTTTGAPPVTITMYDDGLHGDGAAGDGVYGAQIPLQANGTTVNYGIAATDNNGSSTNLTSAGSYTVGPAPTITTTSPLANGNINTAYSQTLAATGGTPGYTWSVTSGSLPTGLTLSSGGLLSGTPTAGGDSNFTIRVTDSLSHIAAKAFTVTITTTTPPNVVVIITDDQGWGDIGYHTPSGQVPVQTPNMDSFATTGVRFERFYATTVCSVTRSTFLTGRNPIRHATNNVRGTDLSEHLMPQTFKAAGYQTFIVGKWHMGGSDKNNNHFTVNGNNVRFIQEGLEYAPYNRGWDSHYGQYSGAIDYFTHHSAETDSLDIPDWWLNGVQQDGPSEHTDSQGHGGWSPDLEADKAIYHIQNRDTSKPMLLHLAFNAIHGPISAPPALITKYANLGVTDTQRRLTCAAVDGMDQAMGRVLAALDAAGIANNTVVVWFSDNGGDETKGSFNDPLRGDKGDSYEGGLRTPAGIRWPGVLPAGVISSQPLWVGDLFPTICAAVGVTPQNTKPLDGVNMWPALLAASNSATVSRGTPLVTDQAAPIAIYQYTDPVNGGTKDFKLRRGRVNNVVTPELFNLTDDPYETTDLVANPAYASIINNLTAAVTAITAENFKPYIGPPLITNSVAQGGSITLYAPFTSYPNASPTVQWRKGGVNVSGGVFTQITDSASAVVRGSYATTLTLTNVAPSNAGTYDVVITNTGGTSTSAAGTLTVTFGAPVLNALPTYTKGTAQTVTWPTVAGANSYTIQRAATSDFASILSSQTVSTPTATFTGLTSGSIYYYRATATDGVSTSDFSNSVSSTQDAGNPVVAITSPADGATVTTSTVVVQGTATDAISGIAAVSVNGVAATVNGSNWSATVPLVSGANTITATASDTATAGGNLGTASISVTLNAVTPVISNVTINPTSPTFLDPVTITARVQAGAAAISQVRVSYDTGTPVSTTVWREIFANTSSNNWNGSGALYPWTTAGGGVVRQAVSTSNHTAISVTSAATTSGSTTVTCASTANLWPGMLITGPNIPGSTNGTATGNTTIASITNGTTFVLSQAATGTGTGLTLNIASVVLTNATTTTGSPNVTCDNTAGLLIGMSLTGTGLANNATVAATPAPTATTFTMNANPTTPGSALTLTASGAAAEFNGGTANLGDSMFATTNAINATGAAGYVEFWVQTRDLAAPVAPLNSNNGWVFQVSSDNGATWNTRLSEDWNSETVNLTNCVLNGAGAVAGSTTVTCTSTAGLTTGCVVAGPNVYVTCGLTNGQSSVTCTNTTGLLPGMALQGTGIPNNTRIGAITANVSFTLVTGTTATAVNATATNPSAAVAATYFPTATVSSITNGTTFVLNTPAYVNTTAAPIAATATTVNHAAQLFHYDLVGAELGTQTKLRFQGAGYTPTAPTRSPRISIDDILVATTAPPAPVFVTMFDDGLHGDGAAGDGVYGAQIPALGGGTTVSFSAMATDTNAGSTTAAGYSYAVNSTLTDATIKSAEFLGMPTDTSVTLNVVANLDQYAFVEYGTVLGSYTAATPITLFSVDPLKTEFYNPIEITITGLQPDTEYYYRFRHRDTTATAFKARGERSFHTARPRGRPFVFTVTADPHLDVNSDLPLFLRAMSNIAADGPDIH